MQLKKYLGAAALLALMATPAFAKEHPMGPDQYVDGMQIGSVYLEPIVMDKPLGLPAALSSCHLELDIHATKDNKNTFQEGWWIPYLTVEYTLNKVDPKTGQVLATQTGQLMPMIADDGPHYGRNVKLMGVGDYTISYHILPPSMNKQIMFGRHIEGPTKAPAWFKPFTVKYSFYWNGDVKDL